MCPEKIQAEIESLIGYILLFLTILCMITFLIISFKIVGGSCLESGNYYNHIQECVFICLRLNWL